MRAPLKMDIGASGFTGLELIKILIAHPKFDLTYIANSEGGTTLEKLHPSLKGVSLFKRCI